MDDKTCRERPVTPAGRKISGDRSAGERAVVPADQGQGEAIARNHVGNDGGLLKSSFEWHETFAEPKRLSAELLERQKEDLKPILAEMRRQGWGPLLRSPYWRRLRWRRARAQRAALSG